MNIENISLREQNPPLTRLERVGIWIYEHPTTVKILEIAALILGIGMVTSLPFTAHIFGTGIVIGLAITGSLFILASAVALFALDILVPPHHDMKNHVYKPGQCDGGRLYYEGDVPILSLDSDDPFKAGKAQGYLCGDAINRLSKRFDLVQHTLAKQPRADQLPNTLAAIRKVIPEDYLLEMKGLIEGYNQWAKEQYWWQYPKKITEDDVLLFHLIPDSLHFQAEALEKGHSVAQSELAVACCAIVDQDPEKGLVFARNMDWPSFGLAGTYSLIVNRKHANGLYQTIEVGIPGLVGTLTGMNDQGMSLAMNVSFGTTTNEIRGMPACLYNRACLEQCRFVYEVEDFTNKISPLGAYHLTVVSGEAASVHFYQSPSNTHVFRYWEEGKKPLVTLNCCYTPEPDHITYHDVDRQQVLDAFFKNRNNRPLEKALSLHSVNNWITTHQVVIEPKTSSFMVAFDNAFAGNAPLHSIPVKKIFSQ